MSKTDIIVKQFSSNGETFEIGLYHEIEILIRKSVDMLMLQNYVHNLELGMEMKKSFDIS